MIGTIFCHSRASSSNSTSENHWENSFENVGKFHITRVNLSPPKWAARSSSSFFCFLGRSTRTSVQWHFGARTSVSVCLCVCLVCKIKKINLLENSRGFKFPKGFSTDSKFLTRTWLFPVKRDLKPWRRDFPIKGNLKFRIRDFENQTNYLYVANAVIFKTRGNRKPITFRLFRVRWRNIFNFFPIRWIE